MKNFFVTLLISLFCLSGCSGDRCIDADDFGFIKFVVSSRYKKEELTTKQEGNQIAPWVDSGYRVNGQPLTILVKTWTYKGGNSKWDLNTPSELSAWGPWYGQENNFHTLSAFCVRLQECRFAGDQMCTPTKDAQINNAPCILKNGVGLYMLIARSDPNSYEGTPSETEGITRHLGEPLKDYQFYDFTKRGELVPAGGINYQYEKDRNLSTKYVKSPLYFKILDKFYEDNNGQYRLVIKSGVSDTRPDPIEYLTKLIKEQLFGNKKDKLGIVQQIFEKIIKNPTYRNTLMVLLALYVMFTGASFLIGNINFTHTELIVRLIKIIVVSMLLNSTTSWQFFHDYLFTYFIDGVEAVKQMIDESAKTGPGSASIIGLMIAPQTMAKLFSLLFVDSLGFFYIFLFLIALYFIFMLVFKATIIYLTALIAIGMIITMGPIFICFILFSITRSLFENWLRQLISYAIQPIILFTGLAFIGMIVRTEIYSTLGFAVCKYDFPDLAPITELFKSNSDDLDSSIEGSFFYWWFPSPMRADKFTHTKAKILVPIDHTIQEDGEEKLCQAYECIEERYIEFPFLDPLKDRDRLESFFQGTFVQLNALWLIFVCVYLLSKFNDIAVSTARFLTSTSGNLTNLQSIGSSAYNPIYTQINRPANYVFDTVKREGNNRIVQTIGMFSAGMFENVMINRLKRQALDPKSANSSVVAEVKRKYGLDFSNVNVKAPQEYYQAVDGILKKLNSTENAENFVGKNYAELRDYLAKRQFDGKAYDSLSEAQKKELEKLMKIDGKKSLKELATQARSTKDWQKAYVNTHQAMSARGIGILGKNIPAFRAWKEMDVAIKEKERLRKEKLKRRGEKIYETYNTLKRAALTAAVGEEIRDAYEGNLTGAEWHDFDYNDPRLRTTAEIRKDEDADREDKKLELLIDKETLAVHDDISSPEYLAKLEQQSKPHDVRYYEDLTERKLIRSVYQSLIATQDDDGSDKDPILMGERFMREKATDMQTRTMIDKIYETEKSFLDNDRYLRRKEDYEVMYENAQAHIEEMGMKSDQNPEEVEKLNSSIQALEYSKKVLNKIEKRKEFITTQFRSHVKDINQIRASAQMSEYNNQNMT